MAKRLGVLASTVATLLSTGFGAAANADYEQCPNGAFCVWTGYDGSGRFAYFYNGSDDLRKPIGGHVFDNQIVSFWNRTSTSWCLYDEPDYRGSGVVAALGGRANLPASWQRRASSVREVLAGIPC